MLICPSKGHHLQYQHSLLFRAPTCYGVTWHRQTQRAAAHSGGALAGAGPWVRQTVGSQPLLVAFCCPQAWI